MAAFDGGILQLIELTAWGYLALAVMSCLRASTECCGASPVSDSNSRGEVSFHRIAAYPPPNTPFIARFVSCA